MKYVCVSAFIFAGLLFAQDGVEKATVPVDASRPPRLRVHLMNGSITVKGVGNSKEVAVEARMRGGVDIRDRHPSESRGMKRLNLPGNAGLDISEDDNVINIKVSPMGGLVDLIITTPRRSSVQLRSMSGGDIDVEQVEGEIEANNMNGKVTLKNVSGTVNAHSLNGEILATLERVDAGKPLSFSTMNGAIDVTLPPDPKANVRLKTDHGDIYSDFEVKFEPGAKADDSGSQTTKSGHYRLRFDRTLRGTINGGGPEYQITTFNGEIYLRKRK